MRIDGGGGLWTGVALFGFGVVALLGATGCFETHAGERAQGATTRGPRRVVPLEDVEVATFRLDRTRELVPPEVEAVLERVEQQEVRVLVAAGAPDDLIRSPWIQCFNVPRADEPALRCFIAHRPVRPTQHEHRLLFLHDPAIRTLTPQPIVYDTEWLGDGGVRPRLADLDLDGRPELVYRDFKHDGTVDNVEQAVFVAIGDDLSMTEVLRIDVRTSDAFSRGEWGVIRRRLARFGDETDRLVLESWRENPRFGGQIQRLPDLDVTWDPDQRRWSIQGAQPHGSLAAAAALPPR